MSILKKDDVSTEKFEESDEDQSLSKDSHKVGKATFKDDDTEKPKGLSAE